MPGLLGRDRGGIAVTCGAEEVGRGTVTTMLGMGLDAPSG
ncbi:hypothetical protein N601_29875 [Rhodococcus erythropolis DN1]|nr:hypothetical protein N601_29875 [Rhodococcus erythropolis DN1]